MFKHKILVTVNISGGLWGFLIYMNHAEAKKICKQYGNEKKNKCKSLLGSLTQNFTCIKSFLILSRRLWAFAVCPETASRVTSLYCEHRSLLTFSSVSFPSLPMLSASMFAVFVLVTKNLSIFQS